MAWRKAVSGVAVIKGNARNGGVPKVLETDKI